MHFGKLAWLAIKGVHVPVVQVSRCLCLNILASRCKPLQLMLIIILFFGRRARWQWWVGDCLQIAQSRLPPLKVEATLFIRSNRGPAIGRVMILSDKHV